MALPFETLNLVVVVIVVAAAAAAVVLAVVTADAVDPGADCGYEYN